LASALAAHISSGIYHGALSTHTLSEISGWLEPFALFGWATDSLPRDLLLDGAARRIAGDLLARTARPSDEGRDVESMMLELGTEQWNRWIQTRDEVLLNRRRLLESILEPSGCSLVPREGEAPK